MPSAAKILVKPGNCRCHMQFEVNISQDACMRPEGAYLGHEMEWMQAPDAA
jgi:hypothetical protein